MNHMKTCIKCGGLKPLGEYHKHSGMKDGRLNKCRSCVVNAVAEWRLKNPDARAKEYANGQGARRLSRGLKRRPNGQGEDPAARRRASLKYAHKRRIVLQQQPKWDVELDDFAFAEAKRLCEMRSSLTGFKWELDHVVPINHRKASGLHNAYNFQVVPAKWNNKKMNTNMDWYFPRSSY